MQKDTEQKTIKVLDVPLTFIEIDADEDPTEAKENWLKKYNELNIPFDQFFPHYVSVKKKMHRTT